MNNLLAQTIASPRFEKFITVIIVLNAITLGLETSAFVMEQIGSLLVVIDKIFLAIFTLELLARIGLHRLRFFRDPWSLFDLIIVSISLLPASGSLSVLRSLRVLRTLRLISVSPHLRKVVSGLLSAIPGLGAVGAIMGLLFYVSSVMATKLFRETFPDLFGTMGESSYTLFQVMTLEGWSMEVVRPVMEKHPYAWVFFVPFIVITTFTMLNLFIAVIVNSMQADSESAAKDRAQSGHDERQQILLEMQRLSQKVDALASKVSR